MGAHSGLFGGTIPAMAHNFSIFSYLDYRHYLADLFSSLKEADAKFSYRAFARMAGSSSPNFLQLIRSRKLNISSSAVTKLGKAVGLTAPELAYFETIVAFDHAKTHEEKERHFQRMLTARHQVSVKELEKAQYEYYADWYMPVVRELITRNDYPNDPAWIAERIVPQISASKARKAIESLEALSLIRWDEASSRWVQVDRVVRTPSEVLSVAVTKHTKKVFALGEESIERFAPSERDLRGVTVGVSREGYQELKERMERYWKEILAFAATQKEVDQVYQINLQLFPMSREESNDK